MSDENPNFYVRIEEGAYDATLQANTTPTVARVVNLGVQGEINKGAYDASHAVDTTPTVARILSVPAPVPAPVIIDSGSESVSAASSE